MLNQSMILKIITPFLFWHPILFYNFFCKTLLSHNIPFSYVMACQHRHHIFILLNHTIWSIHISIEYMAFSTVHSFHLLQYTYIGFPLILTAINCFLLCKFFGMFRKYCTSQFDDMMALCGFISYIEFYF